MIRRLAIILAIGALLLGALGPTAFAQSTPQSTPRTTGTIKGKVSNKTAGATNPTGLEVTLQTLRSDSTDTQTATAKVANDGSYQFTGLDTSNTLAYVVSTKYNGVDFSTDFITFSAGESEKDVDLNVYETTDNPKGIGISQAHTIIAGIDPQTKQISILEILVLSNPGDRAYIGKKTSSGTSETLSMTLPQQATDVQFGNDDMAAQGSTNTYSYNRPIVPGESQVTLAYYLPYTGSDLQFTKTASYAISNASVVVPQAFGAQVVSQQLSSQSIQDIQGTKYLVASGSNLAANAPMTVKLANIGAGTGSSNQSIIRIAVPAVVVVGLGVIVALLIYRRRSGVGPHTRRAIDDDEDEDEGGDDNAIGEFVEP